MYINTYKIHGLKNMYGITKYAVYKIVFDKKISVYLIAKSINQHLVMINFSK